MSTPVFETPNFGEHEEHEEHENELNTHADFRVQYLFNCRAALPAELIVTAFDHFSGIEEVSARWIVGRQQGLSQLTRGSTTLTLE